MQQAIQYIQSTLSDLYSELEIKAITRLLLSKLTDYNFTEIIINKNTIFSANQRLELEQYFNNLQNGMPIQYVLGETEFCGLNFMVNESVLIPRPETEELVNWVVQKVKNDIKILDIGTGSGCIAIALKHFLPNASVHACDISKDSLQLAQYNAQSLRQKINFFQLDILNATDFKEQYDVIVSNPPYIPIAERADIARHVKDFEPAQALFVPDDDPLVFYRNIALFAQERLNNGGILFFEVHRDFGETVVGLLHESGFVNTVLKHDIAGNHRMVMAEKHP